MKEKKLKKVIKTVIDEVRSYYEPTPMKEIDDSNRSEYDSEVSLKFKNMVLNLINYKENLQMSVNESRISISCQDISSLKNGYNKNKLSNDEDYMEITIRKDVGFEINHGYRRRTSYQDSEMYNELKDEVKTKLRELNSENFNEVWTEVMKQSGVLRDNNLNEIFNG